MNKADKQEMVQLLDLAEDYLVIFREVLELTSGNNSDKWRIDDWQEKKKKVVEELEHELRAVRSPSYKQLREG